MVAYLCHEDTKETGGLYERTFSPLNLYFDWGQTEIVVGAAYYAKLRWQRTQGVALGNFHLIPWFRILFTAGIDKIPTPEDIASNYAAIADFSKATNPSKYVIFVTPPSHRAAAKNHSTRSLLIFIARILPLPPTRPVRVGIPRFDSYSIRSASFFSR